MGFEKGHQPYNKKPVNLSPPPVPPDLTAKVLPPEKIAETKVIDETERYDTKREAKKTMNVVDILSANNEKLKTENEELKRQIEAQKAEMRDMIHEGIVEYMKAGDPASLVEPGNDYTWYNEPKPLDVANKKPEKDYRWVNPKNVNKWKSRGFEVVHADPDDPEATRNACDMGDAIDTVVYHNEMVLMQVPIEKADHIREKKRQMINMGLSQITDKEKADNIIDYEKEEYNKQVRSGQRAARKYYGGFTPKR